MSIRSDGVLVFATDIARSAAFYENDLGLVKDWADGEHIQFHLPTAGDPKGAWLLLHPAGDSGLRPHSLGTFVVDDVDAVVERLRAAGHPITDEPHDEPWGVRQASVHDPEGYDLTLTTPLG
jgi:catechol 2,3-dioxygenase-like lactoylglutathione lyase family enzyme